jgi:threonine synthase
VSDVYRWCCTTCGAIYPLRGQVRYTCPRCPPAEGRLSLLIDYARVGAFRPHGELSMWRYQDLLPAGRTVRPPLPVGWTPLHRPARLAAQFGVAELYLKNETVNPTGSLKDRASALVTAAALEAGERVVVTASTGNAAAALAGMTAAGGLRCVVLVPAATPVAKLRQIEAYGAFPVRVDGDYDVAVELSRTVAERWGWYCRNTAVNPYTAEGKKTAALEIVEQLGGRSPDAVVVAAGDGNILVGLGRGFADAFALGWIDRLPRLIGVQSAAAPALWRAFCAGDAERAPAGPNGAPARSVADSINVARPQDAARAVAAVRGTGGAFVLVEDGELAAAVATLARQAGVLAEPAGAAPVAALPRLLAAGVIDRGERVVLVCTGSGLKTLGGSGTAGPVTAPTVDGVAAALAASGWRPA